MNELLALLSGGDRRSIGEVPAVIALVTAHPARFGLLMEAMQAADPVVRMRAADAVEKITVDHPEYLQPYVQQLIGPIAAITQQEVRWHVAQLVPRLSLTADERAQVVAILFGYLADRDAIVKTFALQALADLAQQDDTLRPHVSAALAAAIETGSAAVQNRGRKLLAALSQV